MILKLCCFVIFLWSLWAIFCPSYNDGIVGKLIFGGIGGSAYVLLIGAPPRLALESLVLCVALHGVRDWLMAVLPRRIVGDRRHRIDPLAYRRFVR